MNSSFDTLSASKSLQEVGFNAQQAEALAKTLYKAINESVATKSDLRQSWTELQSEINRTNDRTDSTKAELQTSIDGLRAKMLAEFNRTNDRIDGTNDRIDGTNDRIDSTKAELQASIDGLRTEMQTNIDGLRAEMLASYESLSAKLFRFLWIQGVGLVGLIIAANKLL